MPDWGPVDNVLAVLIALSAALVAWQVIWKRGIMPAFRFCRRTVHAIDRIVEATPTVLGIADEFRPNGGTSLRDTVDRIEENGTRLVEGHDRLEQGLLEAIRLGRENSENIIEHGDLYHEARVEIEARIARVEERQDRLVQTMIRLLSQATERTPLVEGVLAALEEGTTD